MSDDRQRRAREIFFACLKCGSLVERTELAARECGGDEELPEVARLLHAHDANASFLEQPIDSVG